MATLVEDAVTIQIACTSIADELKTGSAWVCEGEMKWSVDRGNVFTLSCDEAVSAPEECLEPLKELWKRTCREITQQYGDAAFEVVFCELWLDSGRIIVYPADRPPLKGKPVHQRNERVCLQVCFPWLQSQFDELPDPDRKPSEFKKGAEALSKTVRQLLADASRDPEVAQELDRLRTRAPFRICIVDAESLYELRSTPSKPAVTKWKDAKTKKEVSPEKQAIEFFAGLCGREHAIPIVIQQGAVYCVDLTGSKTVTDDDLARLQLFPQLEKLELQDTPISDAGLEEIGKLLSLRQVNLAGTPITDAGLCHLCNLKKLWKLNVWRTAVTSDGIDALQAALPRVKVQT